MRFFIFFFANVFSVISREECRKVKAMELKYTHEIPAADEPIDKRVEATKALSDNDVQHPFLFENVQLQLPQLENVQPPQIENVQQPAEVDATTSNR
jgi:hypothetical protein